MEKTIAVNKNESDPSERISTYFLGASPTLLESLQDSELVT
jgi:hypothetical protein